LFLYLATKRKKYIHFKTVFQLFVYKVMKRNFSKSSYREKIDKVERKASIAGTSSNEKSSKRRLSIYDDFQDDEMDEFDPKFIKNMKSKR
jgi:hypothetical protein